MLSIPRPNADEFAPFYAGYIARIPTLADPIVPLTHQRDGVVRLLDQLSETKAAFRYASDKWTVKDVIGHMCDTERVFAYRLLRIARGDQTPLPGFDENVYAGAADAARRPLRDLSEDWLAIRTATISLTRGLDSGNWERRGTANGQPISARALVYIILGHVAHHCQVLEDRYGVDGAARRGLPAAD